MRPTLVTEWIQEQREFDERKENTPAIQEVIELSLHCPEELWNFVLGVVDESDDPQILNMLGAGPLEDLVVYSGKQFYDRVAEQHRRNTRFRQALASVWIGSDKKDLVPLYAKLGCRVIEKGDA